MILTNLFRRPRPHLRLDAENGTLEDMNRQLTELNARITERTQELVARANGALYPGAKK